MPNFIWVFKNQPSRYKRAESNIQADEEGPQQGDPGSCLVVVIPLYYRFIIRIYIKKKHIGGMYSKG